MKYFNLYIYIQKYNDYNFKSPRMYKEVPLHFPVYLLFYKITISPYCMNVPTYSTIIMQWISLHSILSVTI